jgi:integrase
MGARPLRLKQYKDQALGRGMRVRDGKYGHVEVVASVGTRRATKCFALGTPLSIMLDWQYDARERIRLRRTLVETVTLRQDVDAYLSSLTPVRRERAETWLRYWVERYGHLTRAELTLAHCHTFFRDVRPRTTEGTFSASSKNKLRTYLLAVWRYLDGRRHTCPVSDIPVFDEGHGRPRELAPTDVLAILEAMGDTPNRARLGVLFTTGCRPHELSCLREADFVLAGDPPYVHIPAAKGGRDRMVTLPPLGVQYAQDLIRHAAFGPTNNLVRDMGRAARRVGLELYEADPHSCGRRRLRVTPYALRHGYAMNMRRAGAGIDDIADALGHRSLETTRRYAGPIPSKQRALVAAMWAGLDGPGAAAGTAAGTEGHP